MGILAGLIGGIAAAGLTFYVRRRPARAVQDDEGWRSLLPRPVLHAVTLLGAVMPALPAWALLSGGSQRPDAATQNMWAGVLAIGFGMMTLYVAWLTHGTRISFREDTLRVRGLLETREYPYADILSCRKSAMTDELVLTLRGGRRLRLSEYFSGVAEFGESLARHGVSLTG